MPRAWPGAGGLALSTLTAYLVLAVAWAAQHQDPFTEATNAGRQVAAQRESLRERGHGAGGSDVHDLQNHDGKYVSTFDGDFELDTLSASQTHAPARPQDVGGVAVRAPVHAPDHPSALLSDRSLRDWVIEDLILMATVDGSIHARDRRTGKHRWMLSAENYPMVETTYNRTGLAQDDLLNRMFWIVEPSHNGDIYLYLAGELGQPGVLQRLGLDVKTLVDTSPYSVTETGLIYNAIRETALYSFDAKTGDGLRSFGSAGSIYEDKTTCHMSSPFGGHIESECRVEGSITLGRVTYTVWIQSMRGDRLCTLRYSEWIPNQRDKDLQSQYSASMDQSYVFTSYNGRVFSLKSDGEDTKGRWNQQLPQPVVRVFDVARPAHTELRDTELVVLPQPMGPIGQSGLMGTSHDYSRVYINQTKPESFYALSERTYPKVTEGAKEAQCYNRPWIESLEITGHKLTSYEQNQAIIGLHRLAGQGRASEPPTVAVPDIQLTIEGRKQGEGDLPRTPTVDVPAAPSSSIVSNSLILSTIQRNAVDLIIVLFLAFVISAVVNPSLYLRRGSKLWKQPIEYHSNVATVHEPSTKQSQPETTAAIIDDATRTGTSQELSAKNLVSSKSAFADEVTKSLEPLSETPSEKKSELDDGIFAPRRSTLEGPAESRSRSSSVATDKAKPPKVRIIEPALEVTDGAEEATTEKKKARRGQRGGKAHRRRKTKTKGETEGDGEGEGDGSIDLPVEKAIEALQKKEEPPEIQPDPVSTQTNGDPAKVIDNVVKIGNLTVFEDKVLGYGSHGTRVFQGTFGGRDVAVKAMLKEFYDVASQEVNLLQESDDHANVVRYYDKETAGAFLYIALELCPATLAEVVEKPAEYVSLLGDSGLDRIDALRQITRGIRYLHSLKIVHRDIKPENILVAAGKKLRIRPDVVQKPRMLISDFGLCKKLDVDQSSFRATTAHAAGTSGWRAPELLVDDDNADNTRSSSNPGTQTSMNSEPVVLDTATNRRATRAIDVFALGCIFFYVLSGGNHPFDGSARGEGRYFREVNIIKGRHDLSDLAILGDYRAEAEDLIAGMIAREPRQRPSAETILAHPFFWSDAKRLEFLCHVSDQFEFEPRDPPSAELSYLESFAPLVLKNANGDFMSKLPQAFLATLAKQRKYQGGRMLDVLRALRNKKNHYEDMPPSVKSMVGSLPKGYLLFWTTRFPMLLMGCHQVIKDCGWHTKDRFREYYEAPGDV